jgi:hypothetical protein
MASQKNSSETSSDDEGYYPATEEAIKEAIEEVREDLVE